MAGTKKKNIMANNFLAFGRCGKKLVLHPGCGYATGDCSSLDQFDVFYLAFQVCKWKYYWQVDSLETHQPCYIHLASWTVSSQSTSQPNQAIIQQKSGLCCTVSSGLSFCFLLCWITLKSLTNDFSKTIEWTNVLRCFPCEDLCTYILVLGGLGLPNMFTNQSVVKLFQVGKKVSIYGGNYLKIVTLYTFILFYFFMYL